DEQDDALVLDRNVTITAGAGTGKTTTLTQRYLEFLRSNPEATPENVVTITFTRKAAAELQERVREEVYAELEAAESGAQYTRWRDVLDEIDESYTHTIHAFCSRLLRENAMQAPVPIEFDVLDGDDAADLQREVVTDYLDSHETDHDVDLLSRLFDSRSNLTDILTELLDARPDSQAWLSAWQGRDVDDYLEFLWDNVCGLDPERAAACLQTDPVQETFRTARQFQAMEFDTDDVPDGVEVLREIAAVADRFEATTDSRDPLHQCKALYDILEKSTGGLYASAGHYLVGTKSTWNDESAYYQCKEAIDPMLAALQEIEAEIETVPTDLDRNSAHYVIALAAVFDEVLSAYESEKARRDALDFPDLIETSITFLESTPDVRESLQDQFSAVMVDEFQDTDQRQWELISLLTGLSDDDVETANVFLVGDKKQSIYGFRGAEVTTFDTAAAELAAQNRRLERDKIPNGQQESPTAMELSGNFRTLEGTLTFLNELFDRVFKPLGDGHAEFEAAPQSLSFERDRIEDVGDLAGSVEYLLVPETEGDAAALLGADHPVVGAAAEHSIAGEAQALGDRLSTLLADPPEIIDKETGEKRTADPSDVAILLRRRTHLDRYQRALDAHDLPYSVISGVGFYDTPEVQALTNLLRVLADPDDDVSLYGVLRSPLFGFTDRRLASLATGERSIWEALQATDDQQLADAADKLTQWRQLAGCVDSDSVDVRPWDRVLTRVIDDTGYLVSVGADETGQQAVANIEKFRDEIRGWSEDGTRTAASLLRRIDRRAELDPREGEAEVPDGTEGIRIMTIHAAKGLEFPIVAVPDIGSDLNFGRSIDDYGHVRLVTDHDADPFLTVNGPSPSDPFDDQNTTAHQYADDIEEPRERAEAKRLLYVACTRSRDHLLLCGTHKFDSVEDPPALAGVRDADEAKTWRDWLQPILLDESIVSGVVDAGETQAQLGDATYTVRLPGDSVQYEPPESEDSDSEAPRIDIPVRPETESQTRVTATDLVEAADESADTHTRGSDTSESAHEPALPRNEFGTIVHRVLEFDAPSTEWPTLIRRIAGVNGFSVTEETVTEVIEHVEDATAFLDDVATTYPDAETHEELSVSVDVGSTRIVGDIDHLRVSSDAYIITDYKTNRLRQQSTEALAVHYRPQLMSYALALLQSDPGREVIANLRFTTVGVTESFQWSSRDQEAIAEELASIARTIE
ncbi:UvrD-helicase domain-containing protein, partial [Halobacterium salinarum]